MTHAVPVFEGYSMPHAIRRVDVAGRYVILISHLMDHSLTSNHRDVTDNLQLLLRKSGHHLHTSAEREVVRTIKEKCCYVALNPAKEEKEALGRNEEFRLPDGNVVQVCTPIPLCRGWRLTCTHSWVLNDSVRQKSCSTRKLLGRKTPVCIKLLSTPSTASTLICERVSSPTLSSAAGAHCVEVSPP